MPLHTYELLELFTGLNHNLPLLPELKHDVWQCVCGQDSALIHDARLNVPFLAALNYQGITPALLWK